jgi:hypothetical protein
MYNTILDSSPNFSQKYISKCMVANADMEQSPFQLPKNSTYELQFQSDGFLFTVVNPGRLLLVPTKVNLYTYATLTFNLCFLTQSVICKIETSNSNPCILNCNRSFSIYA